MPTVIIIMLCGYKIINSMYFPKFNIQNKNIPRHHITYSIPIGKGFPVVAAEISLTINIFVMCNHFKCTLAMCIKQQQTFRLADREC